MGFINHNGNVSAGVLAHEVALRSAEGIVLFGNTIHDDSKHPPRQDFPNRQLFELDRGVCGSQERVPGERLGWIDYGSTDYGSTGEDLQAPAAIVTVPVRVGKLSLKLQSVEVAVQYEDIAPYAQTLDPSKFCKHAIARAVLMAANGAEYK